MGRATARRPRPLRVPEHRGRPGRAKLGHDPPPAPVYRAAFSNFDPAPVATYRESDVERLLTDPGIIRNRLKVAAAIENARAFLAVQAEFGSFDTYTWQFVGGRPSQNAWGSAAEVPVETPASRALSTDLRRRSFRFAGPTICYALMQATGMVNDHLVACFRWAQIRELARPS